MNTTWVMYKKIKTLKSRIQIYLLRVIFFFNFNKIDFRMYCIKELGFFFNNLLLFTL